VYNAANTGARSASERSVSGLPCYNSLPFYTLILARRHGELYVRAISRYENTRIIKNAAIVDNPNTVISFPIAIAGNINAKPVSLLKLSFSPHLLHTNLDIGWHAIVIIFAL
jgi:hypothetical protein